jgi:RNA polymerase sigma factor (sigma-70 family)
VSVPALRLVRSPSRADVVDPTNLHDIFQRFGPYVERIGLRILGHTDGIEDLVQDVFLDAHRGLKHLRELDAVRAWLTVVTVRKARRRLAKRRMMRWLGMDRPVDPATVLDPSSSAEERALAVAAYRILDQLPSETRIAWILHRVENEPLERVAEVLGCSRATAHRRLQQAQRALQEGLTDVEP